MKSNTFNEMIRPVLVLTVICLIAAALLLLLLLVVLAFKKQLIVDPVTRFVSKLFLKPEDNE